LPPQIAARITETVEAGFDPVSGAVLTRRRRRLGALVLQDCTEPADPAETEAALAAAVQIDALPWSDAVRQLRARVALLRRLEPDAGGPDLSDAALCACRDWLRPHLHGLSRRAEVERLDLLAILRGLMTWEQASRLDRELPTHLDIPGGKARVDYLQPVPVAE